MCLEIVDKSRHIVNQCHMIFSSAATATSKQTRLKRAADWSFKASKQEEECVPVQIACNRNWTASVQLVLKKKKESTLTFLCAFFVPFILTSKIPVIPNKGHPPPSSLHLRRSFYLTVRKSTTSIHTTLIRQTLNKQASAGSLFTF